ARVEFTHGHFERALRRMSLHGRLDARARGMHPRTTSVASRARIDGDFTARTFDQSREVASSTLTAACDTRAQLFVRARHDGALGPGRALRARGFAAFRGGRFRASPVVCGVLLHVNVFTGAPSVVVPSSPRTEAAGCSSSTRDALRR